MNRIDGPDLDHVPRFPTMDYDELKTLLQRNLSSLQEYVRRRFPLELRPRMEVQDLVQDIAVNFLEYARDLVTDREEQVRALLWKVARNTILRTVKWAQAERRAMSRETRQPDETPHVAADPSVEDVAERHEEMVQLHVALERLDPDEQKICLLRFWACRSFAGIGGEIGISEEASRTRLRRIRARLAGLMLHPMPTERASRWRSRPATRPVRKNPSPGRSVRRDHERERARDRSDARRGSRVEGSGSPCMPASGSRGPIGPRAGGR